MPSLFTANRTALITGASAGIRRDGDYTASKHFVRAFTESLRAQVTGTGVVVCEAAPGAVATEFDRVAGFEGARESKPGPLRIAAAQCAVDPPSAAPRRGAAG